MHIQFHKCGLRSNWNVKFAGYAHGVSIFSRNIFLVLFETLIFVSRKVQCKLLVFERASHNAQPNNKKSHRPVSCCRRTPLTHSWLHEIKFLLGRLYFGKKHFVLSVAPQQTKLWGGRISLENGSGPIERSHWENKGKGNLPRGATLLDFIWQTKHAVVETISFFD